MSTRPITSHPCGDHSCDECWEQIDTPAHPGIGERYDAHGNFEGFTLSECGEHRALGLASAYCLECRELCSPLSPCDGCALPTLMAALKGLRR